MEAACRSALTQLPFAQVELHADNSSECFNAHLTRLYGELVTGLRLSRSRPYQKNDNRIYADMGVYYNLFQPVLRLSEITPLPAARGLRRRWDTAQTPFQRLCATSQCAAAARQRLHALYAQANPLAPAPAHLPRACGPVGGR